MFSTNVPNISDSIAQSQKSFFNNFMSLYNAFAQDHVPLDKSGAGNHNLMHLQELSGDPQVDPTELAIYSKAVPNQTDQLFIRMPGSNGNGQVIQIGNYQLFPVESTVNTVRYFTFLPGKIIVYFGTATLQRGMTSLRLKPWVAKKIITMDFCAVGTKPAYKPEVVLVENNLGFVTSINVSPTLNQTLAAQYFFLVIANL